MSQLLDDIELRTFGRRRARKATARQALLLSDLYPRLALDLSAPIELPVQDVWLEIGFGGGEHMLWHASRLPKTLIIGCEPFEDGVIKVLSAIDENGLGNIRLHMGDGRDVMRRLPDASIARVFVLFPDPWPKRRHAKRRLVSGPTLDLLARVMKPGAELRVGTDIGDYARTTLLAVTRHRAFAWFAEGPSDWRERPEDWPQTRYEQKAVLEGRKRYFFRFLRTSAPALTV